MTALANIPEALVDLIRPRPERTLPEWAAEHVRITEGPLVEDGSGAVPWSMDAFPLQKTVCEALSDQRWRKVVLMTAPQAFGKTQCAAIPTLLYALEHRGQSALYVAARSEMAVTQWRRKIEPAMKADPDLARLFYDNPDFGGTKDRRDFTNGTSLHFAGAESVGALAAFTVPVVVCDDVQAYPPTLPGFGHPADLALTRSEAYPAESVKHVLIGTAGTIEDYLWRVLQASAFFCPFVPCPACGTYQLIEFERFVFDHEDPRAAQNDCWLKCANQRRDCRIRFGDLPEMLDAHAWVSMPAEAKWITEPPENGVTIDPDKADVYPETGRNTNVAGFWCNAYPWPMGKTWGERCAEYVQCRGDPDRLQDYQQQTRVIPRKQPEIDAEKLTVEELKTHEAPGYAAGTVPVDADLVTCTIDVQSGYVYYLVRAWKRDDGTSWLVELGTRGKPLRMRDESEAQHHSRRVAGIAAGLDEVDALCANGWPVVTAGGEITGEIGLEIGAIDRGYEKDVIESWVRTKGRGRWVMLKGVPARQKGELWPAKPSRTTRGMPWWPVDVNQAKHVLRRLLRVRPDDPGYWSQPSIGIHANTIRAYYRHLASERWNKELMTPRWDKVTPGAANHFLDCETYQVCLARSPRCRVRLVGFEAVKRRQRKTVNRERFRTPDGQPFLMTER
jgi:phage terminase large subunit GpA-like protein